MTFRLALALVVDPRIVLPVDRLDADLLQRANAWLSRRVAGHKDDLLLVGHGFENEAALKVALAPYGLEDAECRWLDSPDDSLGDEVETVVSPWRRTKHPGAIPVVLPTTLLPGLIYPRGGWWWSGLEAADDEQVAMADLLSATLPSSFEAQSAAWAEVLIQLRGREVEDAEVSEYESVMMSLALSRWLHGFDAATENNFFGFSYEEAIQASGVSTLRLGFEAGRDHGSDLDDAFQGEEYPDEGLLDAVLKVCLESRTGRLRDLLSEGFGGDGLLFWSLHSSIWPTLNQAVDDALDDLLALRREEYSELERPWLFVTEGWGDVEAG